MLTEYKNVRDAIVAATKSAWSDVLAVNFTIGFPEVVDGLPMARVCLDPGSPATLVDGTPKSDIYKLVFIVGGLFGDSHSADSLDDQRMARLSSLRLALLSSNKVGTAGFNPQFEAFNWSDETPGDEQFEVAAQFTCMIEVARGN